MNQNFATSTLIAHLLHVKGVTGAGGEVGGSLLCGIIPVHTFSSFPTILQNEGEKNVLGRKTKRKSLDMVGGEWI